MFDSWGSSRSLSKRLMYISGLDLTVYRVRIVERAWILDLLLMIGWFFLVALFDYIPQNISVAAVCDFFSCLFAYYTYQKRRIFRMFIPSLRISIPSLKQKTVTTFKLQFHCNFKNIQILLLILFYLCSGRNHININIQQEYRYVKP